MNRLSFVRGSAAALLAASTAFGSGGYFPTPCWLDASGHYEGGSINYANGSGLGGVKISNFAACSPLPPGGAAVLIAVNARFDATLIGPGGGAMAVSAPCVIQATFNHNAPDHFDTELVQLNIGGGTLPAGVLIRESPALPSTGQTETRRMGGGLQIDSFFDVFTEVSFNGGATWSPSVGATRIILQGPCYANCDQSPGTPALTANDFMCFMNKYVAGDPYANCDGSTTSPALTANDFQCYIDRVANGCN